MLLRDNLDSEDNSEEEADEVEIVDLHYEEEMSASKNLTVIKECSIEYSKSKSTIQHKTDTAYKSFRKDLKKSVKKSSSLSKINSSNEIEVTLQRSGTLEKFDRNVITEYRNHED
jgi:hypothetical protein